MDTMLTSKLLNDAFKHYENVKHNSYVVNPSLPILFFGDIRSYFKQDFKIVTAALNPSDKEFLNEKGEYSYHRFQKYSRNILTLEKSLSDYFDINPYTKWFGKKEDASTGLKAVLNGMEYCFYKRNGYRTALHTDFCSPLATNPTWSGLENSEKDLLFNEGYRLWSNLIKELRPDLIIMSLKKSYLNLLDAEYIGTIEKKIAKNGIVYSVEHFKITIDDFQTDLVWGSSQITPFMPFSNKEEIGKKIGNLFSLLMNENKIENKYIDEMKNDQTYEITKTRFYVDEKIFKDLKNGSFEYFKLNVIPKKGSHPEGYYLIPKNMILTFILSKRQGSNNWIKNANFHQDGIPSTLRGYFKYS